MPRLLPFLVLVATLSYPSPACSDQFVEDFNSATFCDPVATTALWDTTAGEVRLPPFEPQVVTTVAPADADSVTAVAVNGDRACLLDATGRLWTYDITDVSSPVRRGYQLVGSYRATDLVWHGRHVLASSSMYDVTVFDVQDPTDPTKIDDVSITDFMAQEIAVSGRYAYVVGGTELYVVDITYLGALSVADSVDTPSPAHAVLVAGDVVYVGTDSGIAVYDVVDPTLTTYVGSTPTPDAVLDLERTGSLLHAALGDSGIMWFDLSAPGAPLPIESFQTPGSARDLAASGDYLHVADGDALVTLDVTDLSDVDVCESVPLAGEVQRLVRSGEHTFVVAGTGGLHVVDVLDVMGEPTFCFDSGQWTETIDEYGDYLCTTFRGLEIWDISNPRAPSFVTSVPELELSYGATIHGHYAFVTDAHPTSEPDFSIVDIANPEYPTVVGRHDSAAGSVWVEVVGDAAYRYGGDFVVEVWDVSDPTDPTVTDSIPVHTKYTHGMAVDGNLGYVYGGGVSADECWLDVLDLSDPIDPVVVGSCSLGYESYSAQPHGELVYTSLAGYGTAIVDVSDPASPVFESLVGPNNWAMSVAGDIGTAGWNGMRILSLTDPVNPSVIASAGAAGTHSPILSGDYLFSCEAAGLTSYRVFRRDVLEDRNVVQSLVVASAPDSIEVVALDAVAAGDIAWEYSVDGGAAWESITPDGEMHTPAVPGTLLLWRAVLSSPHAGGTPVIERVTLNYATDPDPTGVDDAVPTELALGRACPNPSRRHVDLALSIPSPGCDVEACVYDVAGRLVRTIARRWMPPGRTTLSWDGRDATGQRVAAGVYFLHLDALGTTKTRRIVRLR
jgi:hypothetical protein